MNDSSLKNVIEAALLAAGRPLEIADLAALFEEPLRPEREQVRTALETLAAEYAERGIELKETASGFRVQVRRELAEEISRLWPERPARYSRALLETLALIAYRQPITRGEIEAVRGVAVNPTIVKTLLERNWIRVLGQRDVPGHPELLGTTREFLDYFGLKRLDELPPLAELRGMTELNVQLDLTPALQDERPPPRDEDLLLSAPPDDALDRAAEPDSLGDEPDEDEGESTADPESSAGMVAAPSDGGPGIE